LSRTNSRVKDSPIEFLQHTCKNYSGYELVGEEGQEKTKRTGPSGKTGDLAKKTGNNEGFMWILQSMQKSGFAKFHARNGLTKPGILDPRGFS
jgi:hypothetical protein